MYLFDASSVVNIVKRNLPTLLADGITLDLALYESLNAIWKEHTLLKKIDEDTALAFIRTLKNVFNVIRTLSVAGLEEEVFLFASEDCSTVYDASYVFIAKKERLILVTDDQDLREKASKSLRVMCTEDLVERRR